ncbi:hypothetical protein GGH94_005124 [Coemansia aciculifera]|uniref:Uncharacterized protein n=1 Tax=Coemansia aciculifera TaxID=417176 RepID=A0A9W8M3F5_9FUNG|nr:hypothetical protein GGH94_005124 [Coemansia aciculifera]
MCEKSGKCEHMVAVAWRKGQLATTSASVGRVIRARLSRKHPINTTTTSTAVTTLTATDTATTSLASTDAANADAAAILTAAATTSTDDLANGNTDDLADATTDVAFEDVATSTDVDNDNADAAVDDAITTALTRATLIKTRSRRIATSIKSAINYTQHILSDVENVLEMTEQEKLQAASDLPGIVDISAAYDRVHDAISDLCWVSEDETDLIKYLPLFLELHPEAELMAAKWIAECARSYYMVLVADIAMADKGLAGICQLVQAARNAAKGAAIREEQLRMLAAEQTKWGINIF